MVLETSEHSGAPIWRKVTDAFAGLRKAIVREFRYDAFISYSHAADDRLAPAVQDTLQRLAKPWYRRRALWIFRDKTSLSATPELWPTIVEALDRSRHFVFLASPTAAASDWVNRELQHWIKKGSAQSLLIALTDGDVFWDRSLNNFDFSKSTAIPRTLGGYFREEPLWIDLRWARNTLDVSYDNVRFRSDVAGLAAAICDRSKEDLVGEDLKQHRRALRWAYGAGGVIASLGLLAGIAALGFYQQKLAAQQNLADGLINFGDSHWARRDVVAAEFAYAEALNVAERPQARRKLLETLSRGIVRLWSAELQQGGNLVKLSGDEKELITAHTDRSVSVWDIKNRRTRLRLEGHHETIVEIALSPDGQMIASGDAGGVVKIWNRKTGKLVGERNDYPTKVQALALTDFGVLWTLRAGNALDRFDISTGRNASVRIGGEQLNTAVIRASQGRLFGGDVRGFIRSIDLQNGHDLDGFRADDLPLEAIALSSDGDRLATWGSAKGQAPGPLPLMTVKLWNLSDHSKLATLDETVGFPSKDALAFSQDGRFLAVGEIANGFLLWDITANERRKFSTGAGAIRSFAFVPSSKIILTIGDSLDAWDISTRNNLNWFSGHRRSVQSVTFAPNGKRFASASLDGTVRLWDTDSGAEQDVIDGPERGLTGLTFSQDGALLIGCVFGGGAMIWSLGEGNRLLREIPSQRYSISDQCASADSNSDRLAVITGSDRIELFTQNGAKTLKPTIFTDAEPAAIRFSPEGDRLALIDTLGRVEIRTLGNPNVTTLTPRLPKIGSKFKLAWSPNGRMLASAGSEQILIWGLDQPEAPIQALTPVRELHSMAFSPDGQRLALAGYGEVVILNPFNGFVLARFSPFQNYITHINTVAFDPAGGKLAIGMDNAALELWTFEQGPEARTLRSPERGPKDHSFVPAIAFSTDGRIAALTGYDGAVRTWDLQRSVILDQFDGDFRVQQGLSFQSDDGTLVAGSEDGTIRRIDLSNHAVTKTQVIGSGPVHLLTPSSDAKKYAFATTPVSGLITEAAAVSIWNSEQQVVEASLEGHQRFITAISFHPTLPLLVTASQDRTARLWDLTVPGRFVVLPGHAGTVTDAAFSKDGRWLATACRDGFVRLFTGDTGTPVVNIPAHTTGSKWAESVTFTTDSAHLVTSGYDGSVAIWRTGTWIEEFRLFGHEDPWIQKVAIDPTGSALLTASQDPWVRVWSFPSVWQVEFGAAEAILAELASRTGRQTTLDQPVRELRREIN